MNKDHQLTLLGTAIRQDAHGLFSLNDLHKAAGGEERHRPSRWVENQQTQELAQEISKAGIPALMAQKGGKTPGTYACRELVIAYAAWISAAFHLKVIRVFLEVALPAAQQDLFARHRDDLLAMYKLELNQANADAAVLEQRCHSLQGQVDSVKDRLLAAQASELKTLKALHVPKRAKRAAPRTLTAEEIALARALKAQGLSCGAIARQLGRSTAAISYLTRELH